MSGVAPDGEPWRRLQVQVQGGIATMPVEIGHDEVQKLIAAGAYLLDVRECEGYDAEHLPGAVSLPIKSLDRETTAHSTGTGRSSPTAGNGPET